MLAKFDDRTLDEYGQEDFDPILVGGGNKKPLPPQGRSQQRNGPNDLQVRDTKNDLLNPDLLEQHAEEAFEAV